MQGIVGAGRCRGPRRNVLGSAMRAAADELLSEIHVDDGIFELVLHMTAGDRESALQRYFAGGADCATRKRT